MATCVVISGSTVTLDVQTDPCANAALLSGIEYAAFTETPTLFDIFSQPLAEDLATMWATGFSLPLIVYLSAWALGVVVNFINK